MAGQHYNYFTHFTSDPNLQKLSLAVIVGAGLILLGRRVTASVRASDRGGAVASEALVPAKAFSVAGFFDFFVEAFVNYHDSVLGKENRRYVGFNGTIFLFILTLNILGLIPGMPAATTTVWVNVGMALAVFIYFNYLGIKANGFWGYLKHFCGPIWALAWFMLPLELFSTALRIFTLNLRLYWNITADHLVLDIFTGLTKFVVPLAFYALGTFVAFMQAFIFTTLTMIYILLATQHSEDEHHH
ncbi:MAG: F0F1 ATP synthase subunit A [Bdellovibrionota bacterium]|nr:MAG: F0F1 ATP synthase subunit A [Bdellovibrionota bacterium]